MSKIGLIIGREFNERVRKRTFILTTILTPLLLIGVMVAPMLIMQLKSDKIKEIAVIDNSGIIAPQLRDGEGIAFEPTDRTAEEIRAAGEKSYGYLVVGKDIMADPRDLQLYTYESATIGVENNITSQVRRIIEAEKLKAYDIEDLPRIMQEVKTDVALQSFQIDATGREKQSSSMLSMIASYFFGFMIYMFVLLYGAMVMQGVIEEKSSKVLEIMVSSVRPFELMLGKIMGIAAVAVTQFAIWMVLIFVLGTAAVHYFAGDMLAQGAMMAGPIPEGMENIDPEALAALRGATDPTFLIKLFGGFVVYFIGGYLLYAAMFAAVGSAVDNVQDSSQLQLPITIPLILALFVMINVMREPNSSMAFWFSMIPFTSPIIMMARLPYGVPTWELVTSAVILYASFIFMVWLAGKIYRVGIFMYGKKPSFRELYKWITYKS